MSYVQAMEPVTLFKPAFNATPKSAEVVMSKWQKGGPITLQPAAAVPPTIAASDIHARPPSLPGEPIKNVRTPCPRAAATWSTMGCDSTGVMPAPLPALVQSPRNVG